MNAYSRQRPRGGITLLELTAAIAAHTTIAGVAVAVVVSLARADRNVQNAWHERVELARFTTQLREDLKSARDVAWDPDAQTLLLSADERQVVVERRGFALVRMVRETMDPSSAATRESPPDRATSDSAVRPDAPQQTYRLGNWRLVDCQEVVRQGVECRRFQFVSLGTERGVERRREIILTARLAGPSASHAVSSEYSPADSIETASDDSGAAS
ncbi:MAG: hypothetical protein KDA61_19935 [Planctomycetales bacterium]|nr:hypothetical protein [Planctomycetales bacterium]